MHPCRSCHSLSKSYSEKLSETHHPDGCSHHSHFSKCIPIWKDMWYFPKQYSETSFLHRWLPRLIWTLINAQCVAAIKTHQAWIRLNKKHTVQNRVKEKKHWEQRAQGDSKNYACVSLCVWLGYKNQGETHRGLCFLLHNHMRTVFCILMQACAL